MSSASRQPVPGIGHRSAEEARDGVAELRQGVGVVDLVAEVRAVVEAARVPGGERADLVDDPAVARWADFQHTEGSGMSSKERPRLRESARPRMPLAADTAALDERRELGRGRA